MKSEKVIREEISQIYNDSQKLYKYLVNLAKHSEKPSEYKEVFDDFLSDRRDNIKGAAMFALLFVLKRDDQYYRNKAIEFIENHDEEILRRWSISGLGQAFKKSQDPELLRKLYELYKSTKEDEYMKLTILGAMLTILGSEKDVPIDFEKLNQREYSDEFERIKRLIKE